MPKKNNNNNRKKQKKQHNKKKVVASVPNAENQEEKENLKIYEDDLQKTIQRLSLAEGEEDPNKNNMKNCRQNDDNLYNDDIFREIERIEKAVKAGLLKDVKAEMNHETKSEEMFNEYYRARNQEKQKMDIDLCQEKVEKRCYKAFSKKDMEKLEIEIIKLINVDRAKESKSPIMFHKNKNADFDITIEEIKNQIENNDSLYDDFFVSLPLRNVELYMSRCMYDYLEEKYKKEPVVREEYAEDDNLATIFFEIEVGKAVNIEELKKADRRFDRIAKLMKGRMCAKTVEFVEKQRITCKKAIKLMKQLEKLKGYNKLHRWRFITMDSEMAITTDFRSNESDYLDNIVDACYWILMKQRKDEQKPQLTLHLEGDDGSFEMRIEEVERAVRFLSPSIAQESNNQLAIVLLRQFKRRHELKCGSALVKSMNKFAAEQFWQNFPF